MENEIPKVPEKNTETTSTSSDWNIVLPEINFSEQSFSLIHFINLSIAALSLGGGIILFFFLLPGSSGYGYSWKMVAYLPSVYTLFSGIIVFTLFASIDQGLVLLKKIADNISAK